MSARHLTEKEWKTFARTSTHDGSAFLRALTALARYRETDATEWATAIDDVEKQAAALVSAHRGDKALARYVADVSAGIAEERKRLQKLAAQEEREETGGEASRGPRLVALLRDIRKGADFPALIASGGPLATVLVSRRALSASSRKLLAADLGEVSGVKYFSGRCVFEEQAVTFVLQTQPGGIARKLAAALLRQTGLRIKIRVRGPEGVEADENEPGALAQAPASAPTAAPGRQAHVAIASQCLRIWLEARDKAHADIARLETAVQALGDPASAAVAMRSLQVVRKEVSDSMAAPLADFANAGQASAAGVQGLRQQITRIRTRIAASEPLRMVDENPFGVRLQLRTALDAALGGMEQMLESLQQRP